PHSLEFKEALQEEYRDSQPKGGEEGHFQGFELFPLWGLEPKELPQAQNGQGGKTEFQDHLYGGYRPEFVVERKPIDHKVREQGKVLSPGQQQRQNCPAEQPPFCLPLDQYQGQEEQKNDNGPQIGGPGHDGLLPPI